MRDKIVASLTQMNQRGERGRVDPMGEVDASAHDAGHVARILQCLEALASRPCTVDSLARELGVHRRTVLRTLRSMIELGYVGIVGQENGQPLYRATLKLTTLAKGVTAGSDLREMSAPFVSRVRDATNESAHLSVGVIGGVRHLVQAEGDGLVMVRPRMGELVPYHATAVGKAILAFDEQLTRRAVTSLVAYTSRTIISEERLRDELARIRQTGVSVDDQENSMELRCVAAPVFDDKGVVAALGVSAPSSRFGASSVRAAGHEVRAAAAELSAQLGGKVSTHVAAAG